MNNFISTNRNGETKLSSLPIGPNKTDHQDNNNILGEIIVFLFLKSAPRSKKRR